MASGADGDPTTANTAANMEASGMFATPPARRAFTAFASSGDSPLRKRLTRPQDAPESTADVGGMTLHVLAQHVARLFAQKDLNKIFMDEAHDTINEHASVIDEANLTDGPGGKQ